MIAVHDIPASAKVVVEPFRCQHIINVVVDSLKREVRAVLVALGGMVKYNI